MPPLATTLRALPRVHLAVGIAGVLLFLGSGAWMHFRYDHLRGLDDTTRMLFRSTHIYLLWASLLNAALGLRSAAAPDGWRARVAIAGSVLVLVAPVLLIPGFLQEPFLTDLDRPFTRPAIYAAFGGMLGLLVASVPGREA